MRKIKPYIPAIAWMAVIFILSTPFFDSALTKSIIVRILDFLGFETDAYLLEKVDFFIRKSAHVFIYAVLAILWYKSLLKATKMGRLKAALTVLAISILWAASDELHQYLGGDRTAKVSDVALDSTSAALSVAAVGFITGRKKKSAESKRRFKTYYKDRKLGF